MSHFAKVDKDGIVQEVHVVDNENVLNESGKEEEAVGIAFLNKLHGEGHTWVQTSYNTMLGVHKLGGTPFRKNYAGPGCTYDKVRDAFILPKPRETIVDPDDSEETIIRYFDSWTLNETTCEWESPVEYPMDGKIYKWNEDTEDWDEVSE